MLPLSILPRFSSMLLMPIVFILSILYINPAGGVDSQNQFSGIKTRLVKDGFTVEEIGKIYDNPKVSFELKGVSMFFVHSESKLNYDQFLSDKSINSAVAYMKSHETELQNAQTTYGVDKTVITAIMLVETRFGSYLGNRAVINTLSTMSALSESSHREALWNFLSNEEQRMTRDKFDKKADKKSDWAYKELKSLIKYAAREGIDPVEIKGSYAGAFGISQFLPSNALTLAKDGNLDGKVDLFNHTDAINSIANYLKHYGWRPDINRESAYKVLYKYNHSKYYVETLLKISDRLKS
ncbi:MAG: lytic murein transglycosylase [Desulfamplus sp.]|nr:lytic murein transglycosylase [Desulfamplus sp.]